MTRRTLPGLALAAAALSVALAACGVLKQNEGALAVVNGRVVGMTMGEFSDRYGGARARATTVEGGTSYDWTSPVPYAMAGPGGLDERICTLRLAVDARGRITGAQVIYDAQGVTSTSRCGEIFAR